MTDGATVKKIEYRPDIDGLRALAVLAVVIFHYSPERLPGGFVGVDIFFVISGYLITGILVRQFAAATFSLRDFYERRIRRIFPALLLILAFCLLAGWFLMFPSEYDVLGRHVAAGAGFILNFVLWQEAGYFDAEAISKPLLHLWSLAVEEQFYVAWPLILWLSMYRRWRLMVTIGGIAVASFSLNVWSVLQDDTTSAFYSPLSRAWELMVGAGLAARKEARVQGPTKWREFQSCLGLAAILIGIVVIREEHFPGFWALLPVLGTALVIDAGVTALPNRTILAWKPVVWTGLISYPLYLWHWVLWSSANLVLGDVLGRHELRRVARITFVVALGLSWLSYRYVERPIRHADKGRSVRMLMLGLAMLGMAGLGIHLARGLPTRPGALYDPGAEVYLASLAEDPLLSACSSPEGGWSCVIGDVTSDTWIMVHGDSHSRTLIPAFDRFGRSAGIRVVYRGASACLGLLGVHNQRRSSKIACREMAQRVTSRVQADRAAGVIIMHNWTGYAGGAAKPSNEIQPVYSIRDDGTVDSSSSGPDALRHGLEQTLAFYERLQVPVLLVKDNPQQPGRLPKHLFRFNAELIRNVNETSSTMDAHRHLQAGVDELLDSMAERFATVATLSIDQALCDERRCPWMSGTAFLYTDIDHLSTAGAMQVYPLLAARLNEMLHLDAEVPPFAPLVPVSP